MPYFVPQFWRPAQIFCGPRTPLRKIPVLAQLKVVDIPDFAELLTVARVESIARLGKMSPLTAGTVLGGWGVSEKSEMTEDIAKAKDAASSLFEMGAGARRANDIVMASILIGVAQKLWEESKDSESAGKARGLYRSA
jgi:hypothetical protein